MDQDQLFRMQQENYILSVQQAAQVADLTKKYLDKRIRSSEAGMLTAGHRKKYADQTGTVTEILVGDVCGLGIVWEDGSASQSLPYMVTLVED